MHLLSPFLISGLWVWLVVKIRFWFVITTEPLSVLRAARGFTKGCVLLLPDYLIYPKPLLTNNTKHQVKVLDLGQIERLVAVVSHKPMRLGV